MKKLPFEFNAMLTGFGITALVLLTSCQTVYLKDKSVKQNGDTHTVTAIEASVLSDQKLQDLDVDYNGVKIKVSNWVTKGDAVFVDALGSAIVNGIMAYGTMGGSEAVKAAVSATLKDKITDAAKDAVEPTIEAKKPAAKPKPIVQKVDTASDVAPGKNAVVILGNRKGCPLCRALWKPTFEADTEKALPEADVIDADLTDSPALYKKYFSPDCTVYPYCIVFDKSGNRLGAFAVRGNAATNFAAEVEKLCPGCKPK